MVSDIEIEERVSIAEESLSTHAPTNRSDPLDEELVRKVLQEALEAKRKPEDPWAKCAKEVWEWEESLVEKWKEDINNLLLFVSRIYGNTIYDLLLFCRLSVAHILIRHVSQSGLFSTVLTGFIVPFYVTLAATQALSPCLAISASSRLTRDTPPLPTG